MHAQARGNLMVYQNCGPMSRYAQVRSGVVCHERSRSKRRRATVREMKEGPSGSAIRC
jgi:hypothetical protein